MKPLHQPDDGIEPRIAASLLSAIGGMGTGGILGMFVGATLLALGYQIFMGWVAVSPAEEGTAPQGDAPSAS